MCVKYIIALWSGSLQRVVRRRACRGAPSSAPERVPGRDGKTRAQMETPPLTGSQPAGRTTNTLLPPMPRSRRLTDPSSATAQQGRDSCRVWLRV